MEQTLELPIEKPYKTDTLNNLNTFLNKLSLNTDILPDINDRNGEWYCKLTSLIKWLNLVDTKDGVWFLVANRTSSLNNISNFIIDDEPPIECCRYNAKENIIYPNYFEAYDWLDNKLTFEQFCKKLYDNICEWIIKSGSEQQQIVQKNQHNNIEYEYEVIKVPPAKPGFPASLAELELKMAIAGV